SGNLSHVPIRVADLGSDSFEQEFTLGLLENDEQKLKEIDAALERIEQWRFGRCEECGKVISKERLEALPYARHCIECARKYIARQKTVAETGAAEGSFLCGVKRHNRGLRIRVCKSQARGNGGPVQGTFRILDSGDNPNADLLRGFVGWEMNAEELLSIVRQQRTDCVSPINASGLAVEQGVG